MENWILLVIVIVIIYLFASGMAGTIASKFAPMSPQSAPVAEPPAPIAAEDAAAQDKTEKTETLAQQMIVDGIVATNAEPSSCTGPLSFAVEDYGLPGIGFSEWAMYQTLDPRIVASNREFVADRLGNPQTWTGATYSPDRHDTYDAVPWRGLARPARVKVGSPDQIPDLDTSRYPVSKKFTWESSETE